MTLQLTPIADIQQLNAIDGGFTVFQDTNFGKRTYNVAAAVNGAAKGSNTGGDMLPVQPIVTETTLAVEGNKIAIQNMKRNPTPNRPAQGRLSVANGFQVQLTEKGDEEILRIITQDPNPNSTYRGGGAKPADHTLVTTAALGTQSTPVNHTVVAIPNTFKFPVRITATLSATPALDSNAVRGTVTITGKDLNGNEQSDVLVWTAGSISNLVRQTARFYDPTQTITVTSQGFSAGSLTVTVVDNSKSLTFTPKSIPTCFISVEESVGGVVPQAFLDGIINSTEWGIAEDSIVANLGCLFSYGYVRKNINGGADVTPLSTGVTRTDSQPYTGVQGYLEIEGERVAMDNVTVSIQNGFEIPFYHNFTLWPESRPRRNALRMVTINATLPYAQAQDFESNYLENASIQHVKAVCATGAKGTFGAYDASLELELFKGVQMSMPSAQGSGVTPLTQNVVIEAYTDGSEDDYQIISNQSEQAYTIYNAS